MLAIVKIVEGCKKRVAREVIVDPSLPDQIGKHTNPMFPEQKCPEASVLWPVDLDVNVTGKTLEQREVKYAEVILSCHEEECVFHTNYKKRTEG